MDEQKKKQTIDNAFWDPNEPSELELSNFYDSAFQAGRESLLRAAQDLVGSRSVLDDKTDTEVARGQQALDSLRFLREWMALDPKHNRFDLGESDLLPASKKYRVTVWRASRFENDVNYHNFYGESDLHALANAAQSVVSEVEQARKNK